MDTSVHIATVAALRERIRCLEGGARHRRAVLPFGIKAIDERLPEGGLALGALHEVAGGGTGAVDGAAAAPLRCRDRCTNEGSRAMVRDPPGSVRASAGTSRACTRLGDLCRGRRREGGPRLFRGRPALPQARRGRGGSCPSLYDNFTPIAARRGRLWRDRPRCGAGVVKRKLLISDGPLPQRRGGVSARCLPHLCRCRVSAAADGVSNSSGVAEAKVQNSKWRLAMRRVVS